jgi:two-component system, NarL family, sensor kinase
MEEPELKETASARLRRLNQELSILNAFAEALNRSIDLHQALSAALSQLAELLGLETGWVWLLHEETGEAYLAAAQNLPEGLLKYSELMEGSCYCLDTFRAGDMEGAANVNVVTCSRLKKLVDGTGGLRYHASIPLYAQDKKLGVLNLASPGWRELSPDELRLLHTAGDLLSIAVERARLFARSTELGAVHERNRLAREIHDTLAQGLAGIAMQLETADALIENGAETAQIQKVLRKALDLARTNLEEARRSVLDLRAAPLEGRSLLETLSELVEAYRSTGMQISFQASGADRPLPARLEAGLFRIAQEALSNAARHARAANLSVRLEAFPEQIVLTIQDDGQGFDPEQIPSGRFGLVGIKERARLLGGRMMIDSRKGGGTRLEVSLPFEKGM